MKRFSLVEFSVDHPWLIISIIAIITLGFAVQFPKITIDTDPKNMLPATSDVRVYNDSVEKDFALHKDTIVLGIVNKNGIFNQTTPGKIVRITDEILKLKGVAVKDVTSFSTVDNVVANAEGISVQPLMADVPKTEQEMAVFKKSIYDNPLIVDRLISKDATTTAIYIPLEPGANGKEIADKLKEIISVPHPSLPNKGEGTEGGGYREEKGDEEYYVAGDPVARDTFGAEMFKQMGLFSPIAGMVMMIVLYLLFGNFGLISSVMAVAMISVVWSMGLLIGLGYPVHIMSSMIPVFLMAIATDSIHIFNEFYFRFRELKDKKPAVLDTMKVVGQPVKYTALATAAGFGVLAIMHIIPVKVFGIFIAFGTIVIRLMSFSLIPAVMMLVNENKILTASSGEDEAENRTARVLRSFGAIGTHQSRTTVIAGIIVLILAVVGISKINLNNNMVNWFKKGSDVREADRIINEKLGGTALGYVVAVSEEDDFIKKPDTLRYIESIQRDMEKLPNVGKTFSVVDYVKRISRVFNNNDPAFDKVPDTKEAIAQYLFMFSMSAKPSDMDNVVDYPFRKANIWVQLKTWDANAMQGVIDRVKAFTASHQLPGAEFKPAGTAYFNFVWNNEVLYDMLKGFILALIIVFIILVFNFRSFKWAIIAYMPLLFTIATIYGVVGFIGKDFDMPISVLSCLSLGMAVDFAIHFISRFRRRMEENQKQEVRSKKQEENLASGHLPLDSSLLTDSLLWTAARPGKGIIRNAVLFAAAFSAMIFAPLTPYVTVGLFIASMMFLSALMSIIYLPALIVMFRRWLL
ncbi:MAG: MMPL family transporter [Deltaproteobacteria bacterium]|nr:MMPL family transporter [Deltaproteobacteria bacterium]